MKASILVTALVLSHFSSDVAAAPKNRILRAIVAVENGVGRAATRQLNSRARRAAARVALVTAAGASVASAIAMARHQPAAFTIGQMTLGANLVAAATSRKGRLGRAIGRLVWSAPMSYAGGLLVGGTLDVGIAYDTRAPKLADAIDPPVTFGLIASASTGLVTSVGSTVATMVAGGTSK